MTWYHVWQTGTNARYINAESPDDAARNYSLGHRFTTQRIYVCEEDDAKVFEATVTPGETHHEGPSDKEAYRQKVADA